MKEPFVCEFAIQDSRKMAKLVNRNKKGQNEPKNTNNQSKTSQHKSKSPQAKFNRNGSKSNKKWVLNVDEERWNDKFWFYYWVDWIKVDVFNRGWIRVHEREVVEKWEKWEKVEMAWKWKSK